MNNKVLLGMSGGVDSSVAAYLLKQQGYDVVGLHFTIRGETADAKDVDRVCKHLGIPYFVEDFSQIFDEKVFTPFIDAYKRGDTPNVCVGCNRYIKFGALAEKADELGCDFLATGHFCSTKTIGGEVYLERSKDERKDQTYFLSCVSGEVLKRVIFPLSGVTKEEVRNIARENAIPVAEKKDSSDVCIANGQPFSKFLSDHIPENAGDIVNERGEKVGLHKGLHLVTLGQRKGLNLGGRTGEDGRWFVVGKDGDKNQVIVSHGSEDLLFSREFEISNVNFINGAPNGSFRCLVKTRYRAALKWASVDFDGKIAKIKLDEKERAITKGQYAVMYLDDICLGGGEITKVVK